MKKIISVVCVFLCLLMLFTSCQSTTTLTDSDNLMIDVKADDDATYNFVNGETSHPTSYNSYINAAGDFSFKMLASLYQSNRNVAYSPSALYSQLALLLNASGGDNQTEIKNLIGKNISIDALNQCSGYFLSRINALNNEDNKYYIDINNNLIFNDTKAVSTNFLLKNADFYNQGIFKIDYENEHSVNKVNGYLKERTSQKAPDMASSLEGDMNAYSTAYMKDKWLYGYTNENITAKTFESSRGNVQANFMESTEYYIQGGNCTGFIKSFKNTPCKFIALLPNEGTSAYQLAKSLDSEEYNKILNSMSVFKTCKASLPQFSINETVDFKKALAKNNVDIMFTPEADFSNLSYNATAQVSSIVQNVDIDITQGGICTTKLSKAENTKKTPEYTVTLSRPFIFIIADNESNLPISMGIISNI
ncbi:MAG: serpin family protein [Ruminococcus sp.]